MQKRALLPAARPLIGKLFSVGYAGQKTAARMLRGGANFNWPAVETDEVALSQTEKVSGKLQHMTAWHFVEYGMR